ncbi:MAG: PDDEXK nuclease domain-containing protein [Firmicutes bacterium]|nr:PDDEXK nuclease domain-containing protein [Bacillota bacterium]
MSKKIKNKAPKLEGANKEATKAGVEAELFNNIKEIISGARSKAYAAINFAMVEAYWNIGKLIVEKQGGEERAAYGDGLIENLSLKLTTEFGKGFDKANLWNMRQFFLTFPILNAVRRELSWTHYRLLMRVEKDKARNFYLEEAMLGNWSTRQLERQISTQSYERILASQNKELVKNDTLKREPEKGPLDMVKDPYVLEFLGLKENKDYLESNIEQALIDHLRNFLLELGRGFAFESRQKRITLDGKHFYIDLVFYNYSLKCFVLIDIKAGELTHQDIGQMQMYVNYYTRELMNEGDNPPIGIILCADKHESVVKYTLPEGGNSQIFTSKYFTHLPTEEELAKELQREKEAILREKFLKEST